MNVTLYLMRLRDSPPDCSDSLYGCIYLHICIQTDCSELLYVAPGLHTITLTTSKSPVWMEHDLCELSS